MAQNNYKFDDLVAKGRWQSPKWDSVAGHNLHHDEPKRTVEVLNEFRSTF